MTDHPRILALDPGYWLGYAHDGEGPGQLVTGVKLLPRGGSDLGIPYLAFEDWLEATLIGKAIDILGWEAPVVFGRTGGKRKPGDDDEPPRPTNIKAIEFMFGIATIAELVGRRHRKECWKAYTGTIRRHFVDNGRASKDDVYRRCLQLGWPVPDRNAADAAATWDLMAHVYRRRDVIAGPLFTKPVSIRRPAVET